MEVARWPKLSPHPILIGRDRDWNFILQELKNGKLVELSRAKLNLPEGTRSYGFAYRDYFVVQTQTHEDTRQGTVHVYVCDPKTLKILGEINDVTVSGTSWDNRKLILISRTEPREARIVSGPITFHKVSGTQPMETEATNNRPN